MNRVVDLFKRRMGKLPPSPSTSLTWDNFTFGATILADLAFFIGLIGFAMIVGRGRVSLVLDSIMLTQVKNIIKLISNHIFATDHIVYIQFGTVYIRPSPDHSSPSC